MTIPFLRTALTLAWRDGRVALADAAGATPHVVPAPSVDALPDAFAALLGAHRGRRVRVIVGDEHARLFQHQRPRGARTPLELQAALRLRMQALHGDDGEGWVLRWSGAPWARSDTACALPAALLHAVDAGCRAARVHCASLQADWIACAARAPRRGRAWVLNAGAATLTLGLVADGRIVGVRRLAPPAPDDDLADVMARALPLFAAPADDALAPVWLSGAALPVPLGLAAARSRRLDAEAARPADRGAPPWRARRPGAAR